MEYRQLGRTDLKVSAISFGAWAIGGTWGPVDDTSSLMALHKAIDLGVNFIDTADIYGDGRSERLIARLKRERRGDTIHVATKIGRGLNPHLASGYNRKNLTEFVERSLKNLETEALDLLQLHCPPTEVYYMPETFGFLDALVSQGKVRYYGVSVEKVEEALKAIEYPNLQSVQIVFNIFRQRPTDLFFKEAARRGVGILARLPLASGLLTGKINLQTTFSPDDHRSFNRHGEAFDRGETFAGVDLETGVQVVNDLKSVMPAGMSLPQFALRWIMMFPEVTCSIPGAKNPLQVAENISAVDFPAISPETMERVQNSYNQWIRPLVHHYW